MATKKIILAYHSANQQTVEDITNNLSESNYTFEHLVCNQGSARLHQRISETYDPILIIVSDNFLRCEDCMYELLPTFQDLVRANRVKSVITDGIYEDEETGIVTRRPTSFDRVSNVIQYMNFWQDQYLEVRRQKRQLSSNEETVLNDQLKIIRSISSEIGEFLRFLRNRDYMTYEEFRNNNFYQFFLFNNDLTSHNGFIAKSFRREDDAPKVEVTIETEGDSIEEDDTIAIEVDIQGDSIKDIDDIKIEVDETTEGNTDIIKVEVDIETEQFSEDYEGEAEVDIQEIPGINLLKEVEEVTLPFNSVEEVEDNVPDLSELLEEESPFPVFEEGMSPEPLESDFQAERNSDESDIIQLDGQEFEGINKVLEEETNDVETIGEEDTDNLMEVVETEQTEEQVFESLASIIESGNALIEEGNVYTALRRYEEGLNRYPKSPALRYIFAKAILKYREDFAGTRKQLEQLLEYDPRNTDAYFLLAEMDEIQDNYIAAKFNFEQVISIHAEYPEAQYRLANLLANNFDNLQQKACDHFAIAIAQDKNNADAHYQYAILQDEYFDNKEASIEHLQQAIQIQPDHPFAHYDLAVLYYELGQKEAAKGAYQKAVLYNSEVQTEQNDKVFFPETALSSVNGHSSMESSEVEASKELIYKLQEDIKRLEDLVLKNQNLLQTAQYDIAHLPLLQQEEKMNEEIELGGTYQEEATKTVLITGATSGIGRATASIFAENGYRLILTGRRSKRLEDLKAAYEENYQSEILIRDFDVRDPISVEEMVDSMPEEWRTIDILINNAGLAKGFEPFHEGKLEDWEIMIDTNIKGLLYMTRAISPLMVERGEGHIINICSIAGKEVYPKGGVYCATKHAVDALTKGMRLDLHKHGIRVSQVAPAHVEETEFALVRFDGDADKASIYDDFQPLRAIDVADTIYYMTTRPKHVNIQDIVMLGTQQASATVIDRSGRKEEEGEVENLEEVSTTNEVETELELS